MSKAKRALYITSDWHLDAVTDGVERFDEVGELIDRVIKAAINDNGAFIFAGDLCDPDAPSAHRCVAWVVSRYMQLQRAGIPSLWLTGNHDVVEDGHCTSTLDALEGAGATVVKMHEHMVFEEWALGLLPYTPKTHAYNPDSVVAHWAQLGFEPRVVIGHLNSDGVIKGSESHAMPRGRDMNWPLAELKDKFPDAALIGGHYHGGGRFGDLEIIGAPARFGHGESNNEPAFLELKPKGEKFMQLRHKFANPRRVYSLAAGTKAAAVQKGDIVRVLCTAEQNNTNEVMAFREQLAGLGAISTRVKQVDNAEQAPIDLVERPAGEGTSEDGFAAAERLATEWPKADDDFRVALVGLVKQVGEASR